MCVITAGWRTNGVDIEDGRVETVKLVFKPITHWFLVSVRKKQGPEGVLSAQISRRQQLTQVYEGLVVWLHQASDLPKLIAPKTP